MGKNMTLHRYGIFKFIVVAGFRFFEFSVFFFGFPVVVELRFLETNPC